jgi:putative peptide zinc metalloprotease protein
VVADQMARQYAIQQRASAVELQRLQLVALEDGVVHDVEQTLRAGSWVSPGTRIASVIDTHRWRVKALVSETDWPACATARRRGFISRAAGSRSQAR